MGTLVVLVAVPVAALTLARRLAHHPLLMLGKDIAVSLFVLAHALFLAARWVCRFIAEEVHTWKVSRSSAQ